MTFRGGVIVRMGQFRPLKARGHGVIVEVSDIGNNEQDAAGHEEYLAIKQRCASVHSESVQVLGGRSSL
jgi:hypothetical protein